ncbi:MAG: CpsD/CapB family tyrosine-protein kinase [Caloramator sp.]|nr:CpsD/CapB family tyrosine-protein kinase [Caloramator sp.]
MKGIILKEKPKSPISEAYRTLRTNIQFASFDREIKTIVVTSSVIGEGKSTTAANIAYSLNEIGKKVLLLDCDLRRPSIHKKYNISNEAGISDILFDGRDMSTVIYKITDNLYILTSGTLPPNPAEMLSSNKMREFIDSLRKIFDYIIIDTPPVISVTDAQILSTMADGVILIVSSGEADRQAVAKAKELLLNVKAKILGVVLNKLDIDQSKGYRYYYYYEEKKKRKKK